MWLSLLPKLLSFYFGVLFYKPKLLSLLLYFSFYLLFYIFWLREVLTSSFKGTLFGRSLLASLLNTLIYGVSPEPGTFFLKLAPELFFETSSIFFYLLLYYFFLNIFVLPETKDKGFFSLESLESFFGSIGGFWFSIFLNKSDLFKVLYFWSLS